MATREQSWIIATAVKAELYVKFLPFLLQTIWCCWGWHELLQKKSVVPLKANIFSMTWLQIPHLHISQCMSEVKKFFYETICWLKEPSSQSQQSKGLMNVSVPTEVLQQQITDGKRLMKKMRACFGLTPGRHLKILDCVLLCCHYHRECHTSTSTTPTVLTYSCWYAVVISGSFDSRTLLIDCLLARETKLYFSEWCNCDFPGFRQSYSAALTAKWIRCGAVPLLFESILPEALHQVWIGVLQLSPPQSPLFQPPHPTLRSADEIWPEELQSLLGRGVTCIQWAACR